MGIRRTLTSQGVEPTGALGLVTAWIMPVLFRSLYRKVARMLDPQPGDDVLDVACGSGVFLQRYASHVHHMAGVDHSAIQIKMARKRNRDRIAAGTAEIVRGDSAALPWEESRFSAVTCNSLGCFAEPLRSLQEMHRVLRPDGRVVLSIEFYPEEQTARRVEEKWGLPTWTEAELRKMLDQVGFANVSVSHDKTTMFTTATKAHTGGGAPRQESNLRHAV